MAGGTQLKTMRWIMPQRRDVGKGLLSERAESTGSTGKLRESTEVRPCHRRRRTKHRGTEACRKISSEPATTIPDLRQHAQFRNLASLESRTVFRLRSFGRKRR